MYVRESKEWNEIEGSSVSMCDSIFVDWNPIAGRMWFGHCIIDYLNMSGMVLKQVGPENVGNSIIMEDLDWCYYCNGDCWRNRNFLSCTRLLLKVANQRIFNIRSNSWFNPEQEMGHKTWLKMWRDLVCFLFWELLFKSDCNIGK